MFRTTTHEGHTNECVKPQQAARKTVSANKLEWFDMTSVADGKSNLLQYHENTRVITGAKTVTMHLVTHIYSTVISYTGKASLDCVS